MNTHSASLFFLIAFIALFSQVNATKIGVPNMPSPNATSEAVWETVNKNSDQVKILVVNLDVSLGAVVDKALLDVIVKAQLLGINVFAKIKTGLGKRSLVDVKAEIDLCLNLYKVDGIFFDEVPSLCSYKKYYSDLYAYVKLKLGGLVVLNVKVDVPVCFSLFADVLVVFDGLLADYNNYVPSKWYSDYPASTFWHIIRGCPADQQRSAIVKAIKNKAGFVYVTANVDLDVLGNDLLSLNLNLVIRLLRLLSLTLKLDL
jgi:hypothetical protein